MSDQFQGSEVARIPGLLGGVNLDSADHKSHMSYSTEDASGVFRCDAAHPVSLPYVNMIVRWDGQYPAGDSVTLASGAAFTFHADFMNGWDQARLVSLFDQCIKTQIECGRITSGTMASPVAATTSSISDHDDPSPAANDPPRLRLPKPSHDSAHAAVNTANENRLPAPGTHHFPRLRRLRLRRLPRQAQPRRPSATVTTMIVASGPPLVPLARHPGHLHHYRGPWQCRCCCPVIASRAGGRIWAWQTRVLPIAKIPPHPLATNTQRWATRSRDPGVIFPFRGPNAAMSRVRCAKREGMSPPPNRRPMGH